MKKNTANIITLMSLFCAFYSINETFIEHYIGAIYLIILAFLFDGLDGKIARIMHSSGEFGKELDSLVDAISFGVAPAFLFYYYYHLYSVQYGFIIPFIYVACVVLRLARFNVTTSRISKKYFIGLPCPAAAIAITSLIYLQIKNYNISDMYAILVILTISVLMVSNIYYFSFKNLESLMKKTRLILILPLLFIVLVFSVKEPVILFTLIFMYITSGPARSAILWLTHRYT